MEDTRMVTCNFCQREVAVTKIRSDNGVPYHHDGNDCLVRGANLQPSRGYRPFSSINRGRMTWGPGR